jgi:hypothetical protein
VSKVVVALNLRHKQQCPLVEEEEQEEEEQEQEEQEQEEQEQQEEEQQEEEQQEEEEKEEGWSVLQHLALIFNIQDAGPEKKEESVTGCRPREEPSALVRHLGTTAGARSLANN